MSGRFFANIKAEFDPKDPGAVGACTEFIEKSLTEFKTDRKLALQSVSVPVEALGLIIGIYPFFDMFTTMSNTTGDVAAALVVAKREGLVDMNVYNKK